MLDGVDRLARRFARLGLAPGAPIGLCLSGPEAALALVAAEAAGLVAVLLPLTGAWAESARAIERCGLSAIVTQTRLGSERPAERLSEIAAGYFGLRFLLAFGIDVPDGVEDLDLGFWDPRDVSLPVRRPNVTAAAREGSSEPRSGIVTFASADALTGPMFRTTASLAAAAAGPVACARIEPGDRIVSVLAPDDLKGLATGLVAALLTGAVLETHPVFDAQTLLRSLGLPDRRDRPRSHLVVPGWMEPYVARLAWSRSLATFIFVHPAPVRFATRPMRGPRILDVLAFGETALLAATRGPAGQVRLSPDCDGAALRTLLTIDADPSGTLSFQGVAAQARPWAAGRDALSIGTGDGFATEMDGGRLVGVTCRCGTIR